MLSETTVACGTEDTNTVFDELLRFLCLKWEEDYTVLDINTIPPSINPQIQHGADIS